MQNEGGFFRKISAGFFAGLILFAVSLAVAAEPPQADASLSRAGEEATSAADTSNSQTEPAKPAFVIDWGSGGGNGAPQLTNAWPTEDTRPDSAGRAGGAAGTPAIAPAAYPQPLEAESDATPLPIILSEEDARLYREIFRLQDARKWTRADKLIKEISDPLLLGHVLYERYMHPTGYRSHYKELLDWMRKYRDHPGADRIYKLAVKRRPQNWSYPPQPRHVPYVRESAEPADADPSQQAFYRLSRSSRNYVRRTQRHIRIYVRRGQPTRAHRLLTAKKSERVFDAVSLDESRVDVARGFYNTGKDDQALEIAGAAAARNGDSLPLAHWWAGLAAWRLGNHSLAAEHFAAMTKARIRSDWSKAAAAFWAARAYLVNRQPDQVNLYLTEAAQYPNTFYGLLAIRTLGLEPSFDWSLPKVDEDSWKSLVDTSYGKRALALLQVGQEALADQELKRHAGRMSGEDARMLVALSAHYNMPSLSLRVGRMLSERHGQHIHAALYPLPDWKPQNGFTIDKALVFAVMRQESHFRTRAKSHAGARGLMQLMPGTASFISGHRYRGSRRQQLFEPELNIALAQKYVHHLLEDPNIGGDLFYTVAAYNGGPGNLRKWQRRTDYKDDPLLFIESIPLMETREYVERVLTNLWIYRYRLGQPAPSLDAIAAGEWPSYTPLDSRNEDLAANDSKGL